MVKLPKFCVLNWYFRKLQLNISMNCITHF